MSDLDVLRQPHAERELSNALAAIAEAAIIIRQYMPQPSKGKRNYWDHQLRKLKMARGICSNVRDAVMCGHPATGVPPLPTRRAAQSREE